MVRNNPRERVKNQYNLRGPYKGGLRFHLGVDMNEVKAKALKRLCQI